MDKVILKNVKLKGKHGCFAKERDEFCDFWVSMEMGLDLHKAAKTDELEDTVDYPAAISIAEGVLMGESVRLIETLADRIAERMFVRFSNLEEIKVKVVKRNNDFVDFVDEISAEIFRKRAEYING